MMFNKMFRSVVLVAVGVGAALLLPRLTGQHRHTPKPALAGPMIEQVRQLSALVTTSVDVADVQVTELRGWTGGIRVALLVKGQYLLGTDLSQCHFEAVDHATRTAVLVLPPPAATNPALDHQRTKLYAIDAFGLWQVLPSNRAERLTVETALREAQVALAGTASAEQPVERARRQAELVLKAFLGAIGWDVTIRWSDRR